jgi:predicted GNAT superfamily acetyltransferase
VTAAARKAHWVVRDAVVADHPVVLALNNGATPHVNALNEEEFAWLANRAKYFRVLEDAGGIAGFVLCVPSGLDYWSENYRWFTERYDSFLYLDRVAVAARARGKGVGTALYDDLHAWCVGKYPRVTLEVNLRPPNHGSMRFHERLGYQRVGELEHEGKEDYAVVLYERKV